MGWPQFLRLLTTAPLLAGCPKAPRRPGCIADPLGGAVDGFIDLQELGQPAAALTDHGVMSGAVELYHLKDDRGESHELSTEHPETRDRLLAELHAWQFNGPFLYDFAGNKPKGRRDAGALEKVD